MATTSDVLLERIVRQGLRAANSQEVSADPTHSGVSQIRRIVGRLMANALAAGDLPILRALAPSAKGRCTALALGSQTSSPEQAAAANAAAIAVTQCDEGLRESRGHPGLHAFAAAFAMVEEVDGTVGALMKATAAGWEIGARLGLALGPTKDGVHPHGGWGVGAAAAAAAVAMGFDETQTVQAVANSLTVGLTGPDSSTYAGEDSHLLLPALGTANGVTAARLTAVGLRPPTSTLVHFGRIAHRDFQLGNRAEVDCDEVLLLLAYFKPVGLCAHALTSWETATQLASKVLPGDIERITVRTYAAASRLMARFPTTRLGRQFSIPWAVASGLARRAPDGPSDPMVAALAAVTFVECDPILNASYPASRPAYVTVHLSDGTSIDGFSELHRGDRERPLSDSEHAVINNALLSTAQDPERARRTFGALMLEDSILLRDAIDANNDHAMHVGATATREPRGQ
jgi:2-methylcitrate dehydratase PrpD